MLSISLSPSCRGHPGLAKYRTVWATFSRCFLLVAFSLACAIQIVGAYVRHHSYFLAYYKSPLKLNCRENWICAYRMHQFSYNNHLSSIDLWIPLLLSAKQNAHFRWKSYHNHILEAKTSLADWAFHYHLTKILMMK